VTVSSAQPDGPGTRTDSLVYVHPGELFVGRGDQRVTTILGSCISVCLHDPVAGVGGLNHFLLPAASHEAESSPRYARPAIERLIHLMLREGARPSRLEARIIGGARVLAAFPDAHDHLGLRNAAAAAKLLASHRIPVVASDIGGDRGRKLLFIPRDGTHQVQLLGR